MARLLFTLWDGGGNVPPVLGLAGDMVDRDHEVSVLADPSLRGAVLGAGARHLPWVRAPHRASPDPATEFIRDFEPLTPIGAAGRIRDRLIVGPAEAFADDTREAIREVEAESVISDVLLLGSQVAAVDAGLPNLSVAPNIYPGTVPGVPPFGLGLQARHDFLGRLRDRAIGIVVRGMWDRRLSDANRFLERHGQPPLSTLFDMLERPDRVLVLTSAAFEFDRGVNVPSNVVYCGPRLEDPDWAVEWTEPEGDGPLVLVSLSTTTQGQDRMMGRIVEALGQLPVRGLVSTGPSFDASALEVPGNVTVVESTPHSAVMPRAGAVLTHAGHGTVIKALAHGIPLLCMPVGRDQPDNAARVTASGAGLRLRPGASSRSIARALRKILSEPSYGEAAAELARAIATDRKKNTAVEVIEAFTWNRRRDRK